MEQKQNIDEIARDLAKGLSPDALREQWERRQSPELVNGAMMRT